jgi:hypothetical protein
VLQNFSHKAENIYPGIFGGSVDGIERSLFLDIYLSIECDININLNIM